jgi:signal recognition particle subunit SRP54
MFESLTQRLSGTIERLRGRGRLTEENIREATREVRIALLEADVALPVVQALVERIKVRAVGQEVLKSLTPGQALIKIVRDELTAVMGSAASDLNLNVPAPAVILMAGLQGAGKTTTVAKLAKHLKEKRRKKVMVVSADVYRPAAIEQLRTLAQQVDVLFFASSAEQKPEAIVRAAIEDARRSYADVLIVDTAGRLAIDEAMMAEIRELHALAKPIETLFVVDAMLGQDAVNTAKAFNEALPLTGIVLTKLDGDSRGGAALSVRQVTGKPIKFAGVGEKLDGLEEFHPERMASRILGMGDILSLVEDVQRHVDEEKAQAFAKKMKAGKGFDLEDFKEQIGQMKKLGGMTNLLDKLPAQFGQAAQQMSGAVSDKAVNRLEGIINAMTAQERAAPEIIKASRKRRIAAGAGVPVQEVNRLLNQFEQTQKMMKQFSKGGMRKMLRGVKGMLPGMR